MDKEAVKQRLSISQMAEVNQVTPETLRHYDRRGLLKPNFRDAQSGYRYYEWQQCAQLDMILYLQSLGFTLNEVKDLLKNPQLSDLVSTLDCKKKHLKESIREQESQIRYIEDSIESYQRYVAAPADGSIVLEYLPERRLYSVDTGVNFYEHDHLYYEMLLRKLKNELSKRKLPPFYFRKVGSIWRKDLLLKRQLCSSELFVFVEREDGFAEEELTVLPANLYLCIYCDRFEKEPDYAVRLLDACTERGYQIIGDYLCEVISDMPMLGKSQREMYIRLQIPVLCR